MDREETPLLRRLMDILACPVCGRSFKLTVYRQEKIKRALNQYPGCDRYCGFVSQNIVSDTEKVFTNCPECYQEEIVRGRLKCENNHSFQIDNSIPRLQHRTANEQRTKLTFDVEWKVFKYKKKIYGHSQKEELEDFFNRMVVDNHFLHGKTILDAGCGIGRLTQSIGCLAKEVVGVDFSHGVDEAYRLNNANPTVHIVQGDIMNLPLQSHSFDYVYSKGVIHYVSDARKCIEGLARMVKPSGALSWTVYHRMLPIFEAFNQELRKITVRLPLKIVYWLSYGLIPFLSLAWKLSATESRYIDWNERAHMIFNWLSSEFQNRASNKEAVAWINETGFNRIRLSQTPVGITGIKTDPQPHDQRQNFHSGSSQIE